MIFPSNILHVLRKTLGMFFSSIFFTENILKGMHIFSRYFILIHRVSESSRRCAYTQRNIFENLIKSTCNQIVFTIFRLIWILTDVRLDPNRSEIGKYNLISG